MASSDVLAIERLSADDVAGGLALSDAAGWNQTDDDWSLFIAAGAAFGVRDEAGTLDRDGRSAALRRGHRLDLDGARRRRASPSRHRQPARRCLRRVAARRGPHAGARRDAGRCGGLREDRFRRRVRVRPLGGRRRCDGARCASDSRRATLPAPTQGETLIAVDRDAGGVDRSLLLRSFLARCRHARLARSGGDGFALRRAGRRAAQIGPIVAAPRRRRARLLGAAIDDGAGRVFIDVPAHRTSIADALARRGFLRQRSFVRMALGDVGAATARDRVFALAGPEFG